MELTSTPEIAPVVSGVESSTTAVREDFGKWVRPDSTSSKGKGCVDVFGISLLCQSPAETAKSKPSALPSSPTSGSSPAAPAKPDCAIDLFGVELLCAEKPSPTPTLAPDASASPVPSATASPTPSAEPNCALDLFGLELFCEPMASPTPVPTAEPDAEFVQEGQGCGVLPGSTPCAPGLSCQLDGLTATCKPINPTPTPSVEPSEIPALGNFEIVESDGAISYLDPDDKQSVPSPTPTPEPAIIPPTTGLAASACVKQGGGCGIASGLTCCSGLSCASADPSIPGAPNVCQDSASLERPKTVAFEPETSTDSSEKPAWKSFNVPFEQFSSKSSGIGTGVPIGNNGGVATDSFIRDEKGHLYLVFQRPVVKTLSYSEFQWYLENHVAVSKDNGKTWTEIGSGSSAPEKSSYVSKDETYTTSPALTRTECSDSTFVGDVPSIRVKNVFDRYDQDLGSYWGHACYVNFCLSTDYDCQDQYFRCVGVGSTSWDYGRAFPQIKTWQDQKRSWVACSEGPCFCNPPLVQIGTHPEWKCTGYKEEPILFPTCIR
ncbi:MAG: hypothetical protein Q8P02_01830, partial [Candidatus Micrarchaeota archaeon]|nr:hypothetical protein [Candidatus Micrarchaeota archaeon]